MITNMRGHKKAARSLSRHFTVKKCIGQVQKKVTQDTEVTARGKWEENNEMYECTRSSRVGIRDFGLHIKENMRKYHRWC